MKTTDMIDVLIENIKNDRVSLTKVEEEIQTSRDEKKQIQDRLKESYSDIKVFIKYLDEEQKKKLDELNLDLENSRSSALNMVAETAFDILVKAKDHRLTNIQWYESYLKIAKGEDQKISYSAFNIRCRTLFNSSRVTRTKGKDSTSSKDDFISLYQKPKK